MFFPTAQKWNLKTWNCELKLFTFRRLMFKTAEINFLTSCVHYVSAGQYHSIKQSTVPARSQLSILTEKISNVFLCFVVLWLHINNNEERRGSDLSINAHLCCINVNMQSKLSMLNSEKFYWEEKTLFWNVFVSEIG